MAGPAESEALIVHSPSRIDRIDNMRRIRNLHSERIIVGRLTWFRPEDLQRNFERVHG
jgi:hypothetical protein